MRRCADSRSSRRALTSLASAGAALALVAIALPVRAEESSYCRKVRARAGADAALLYAPTLQAQGIKFPRDGTTDSGVTTGMDYQFRAAVSFSPLDFYKGFRVERTGEADCRQHDALISVQEVLAEGADVGKLPALRKQAALLEARRQSCEAIEAKSAERFQARVASLIETSELRSRVSEIARKRAQVAGEIARLEARGTESYQEMLSTLIARADKEAMAFEREASHVRSLDAWEFKLSGGVIPQDKPVDYFAIVQVGFNLGSFSHNSHESRYLDARAEELKTAKYELREQVRRYREQIVASAAQAKRELAIVDRQVAMLTSARESLEHSEAPGAPHALAIVDLDLVSADSEREFLTGLVASLSRFQENGK